MRTATCSLLIVLALSLAGCQTAGQIRAEGDKYATISRADSAAQAAQISINATATAVTLAAEEDRIIQPDKTAAEKDFIRWKTITINTLMACGALILLTGSGWLIFYGIRFTRARTIEAEARAAKYITFPLDPKTGAYPAIGVGDMLLLPNQGGSLSVTTPREPDRYMVAGATYTQAARLIAENAARAAKEGNGSGVAATNPAMLDTGLDISLLMGGGK